MIGIRIILHVNVHVLILWHGMAWHCRDRRRKPQSRTKSNVYYKNGITHVWYMVVVLAMIIIQLGGYNIKNNSV